MDGHVDDGRRGGGGVFGACIGFVGGGGESSFALGESLRPLLPPGSDLLLLTIPEARQHVAANSLAFMIVALDGESWRDTVAMMTRGAVAP